MNALRLTSALIPLTLATAPVHALLSINVTHDDTLVPGYIVNTFTLDSDTDITSTVALTELTSGTMYDTDGAYKLSPFSTPGDSYISINNDPNTNGGLGYGDLTGHSAPAAFFDENGIGMAWFNVRDTDVGDDMHLMTLTFSNDTYGALQCLTLSASHGRLNALFDIAEGYADISVLDVTEPQPEPDPDPNPDPDPDLNPDPQPNPNPGGNAIPEPVGLGVLAASAAVLGGLHRRRLWG